MDAEERREANDLWFGPPGWDDPPEETPDTDGDAAMTGQDRPAATRFERGSEGGGKRDPLASGKPHPILPAGAASNDARDVRDECAKDVTAGRDRQSAAYALADDEHADAARALDKIERLLRKCERDAMLLDGRDFKARPFAEAYRLLDILRR